MAQATKEKCPDKVNTLQSKEDRQVTLLQSVHWWTHTATDPCQPALHCMTSETNARPEDKNKGPLVLFMPCLHLLALHAGQQYTDEQRPPAAARLSFCCNLRSCARHPPCRTAGQPPINEQKVMRREFKKAAEQLDCRAFRVNNEDCRPPEEELLFPPEAEGWQVSYICFDLQSQL